LAKVWFALPESGEDEGELPGIASS